MNKKSINDFFLEYLIYANKYNGYKGTKNFPKCPLSIEVAPKLGIIDLLQPAGEKLP